MMETAEGWELCANVIVIDLDGTLCNSDHRVHLAQAGLWDEFHAASTDDEVHKDVERLLRDLSTDNWVVVCTGRNERYRQITLDWLSKKVLGGHVDAILMRPDDDFTPDHELKLKMLEDFLGSKEIVLEHVQFTIDDRDKVVEAFRNYGLNCWQCRPGAF